MSRGLMNAFCPGLPRSAPCAALLAVLGPVDSEYMGAITIVMMLGAVAIGLTCWLGYHVRRETLRSSQVAGVRAALAGGTRVAELPAGCGADAQPRFPAPRPAVGDPDSVAGP